MAAYNPGGSLVWSAALNVTAFQSGIQSMVAQMAFAQRAAAGLESSLKSIAAVTFAGLIAGIGGITAAIAISTKAAADWETQVMGLARVAIPEFDYTMPEGKKAFTEFSRAFQDMYIEIPVKSRPDLTKAAEPYALAGYEGEALYNLTEQTLKMVKATNYEVSPDDIANMVIKSAQINREQSGIDIQDPILRTQKMTKYSSDIMDKVLTVANKYTIGAKDLTDAIVNASGSAVLRGTANDIDSQIAFYALMNQYGIRPDLMRTALTSSVSTAGLAGESTARIENALSKIGMQTRDAEGKKIAEFSRADVASKLLGVTKSQYEKMAEENMGETQIRLLDAIESLDVDRLTKNALGTGLFGSYAGREFSKLGAGGALEKFREIQDVSKSSGGEVNRAYTNTIQTLNDQWDLMGQRLFSVKEVFGEIFTGPVLNGVKGFSESLKGAVQWLQQIVDSSRNLDGTVNTWEAIGKVIDGLNKKFVDLGGIDLLKAGGITAGLLLIASNAGTVVAAVSKIPAAFAAIAGLIAPVIAGMSASLLGLAARVSAAFAGINIAPLIATAGSVVSAIAGIAVVAGTVALGLAAIGYSLAPEKFTYFNQVASEALNGVATVARQVYDDISRGDWGAAGDHLKTGFTNAIAWIQQINWNQLGGEIVTMIGDGANAVIGTALDLAGWIYDNLNSWATGGGPRKLGESIGNFIEDGFKTISTTDWGQYIDDAINIASDWGALGWDIISQIGSGFLSGVAGAMTPAANSMIQIVTQAALEIYAAFAKAWNTIIVLAASAATSIGNAFSGVGNTIAGYLQPAIDAVESLASKIAGINLPFIGNIGGAVGEVNPIVKYYNRDSGSSISVEQYNLRKAEGKNYKGYAPVRLYDQNQTTSKNVANIYDFIKSSDTFNKPLDVSTVTQPPTMSTTVREPEEFLYPGIPVIDTSGWNTNYAGYRTGGQGFVMDEMKSAGEGYSYLTTDLGEDITYLGDSFRMANDELKKILPYLIDYPTNTKKLSQDIADSVMPIPKDIRSASDYSRQTNTEINNAAKQAFREYDEVQTRANQTTKDSALYASEKTISTADFVNASRRNNVLETNAMTKQNVVESYSPVRIGLTASGQEIAVIGKVAQQQFEASGNKWVGDTQKSGFSFFTDATTGGKNVESGGTNAGNSLNNGASALDSVAAKLRNLEIMFGGGTVTNKIGDTSGAKYGEVIEGRTLGEYIKELQGSKTSVGTGSNVAPDTLNVDNFEDMTCMGDRVMVNALKYTPPGGKTTSYNPMDSVSIRSASNVEGTFQDMTCIGTSITIPGLKYTNPYGTTSYINPSEYIAGGGVMDYQQTSAKKAGEITVNSAKTSAEYQTSTNNRYAEISAYVNANNLSSSQYIRDMEFVAAVESGNMWKNDLAFAGTAFAAPVNESTFNFNKMADESIEQAYDYLGTQMTVNDKEYIQAKERLEMDKAVIAELTGASNALSGAASKIESAGSNFVGSVSSAMSSFMSGSYSMGGGFGGTSKGGGGAWVGTLPTPGWSGPAISTWVQSHPSGRWGNSSFYWGAKGSLIDEPSRIIAGEKGRELLLPNYLTELFLKLAAMGFNNRSNGDGNIITIVNIDGEQIEKTVSKRQKSNLNLRGLKLH
jgi:hypothetical protein